MATHDYCRRVPGTTRTISIKIWQISPTSTPSLFAFIHGVESIDMSTTVMGQKIDMPLFCAPTALQRLFHHDGERAVAKAAEKFGTMFGISSLGR